jgi:hypothetical protein
MKEIVAKITSILVSKHYMGSSSEGCRAYVTAVSDESVVFCVATKQGGEVKVFIKDIIPQAPATPFPKYISKNYSSNFMRYFNFFASYATSKKDEDPDFSSIIFSAGDKSFVCGIDGNNVYSVNSVVVDF